VGLLLELQQRIPDRWFLRRLLPAAVFVAAVIAGVTLGQSRWADAGLARQRLTDYLGGTSASLTAAALVYLLPVAAGAFIVPVAATAVAALAGGAWPWWLAPLGDRIRDARAARWSPARELDLKAVAALRDKRPWRAARLKARAAAAQPARPSTATWIGDRLELAAARVQQSLGLDVHSAWAELLLRLPENAGTALNDARDGYDAAAEAFAWSVAYLVLGIWWWPAAVAGLVGALTSWRWLRRAADALASTAEAVARVTTSAPGTGAPGT
jgi:hypothetical protein